jgi:hypothetical protein
MKTRPLLLALLLLGPASATQAQVSVDIGFPNINIGFNIGNYPQLVLIPGSPVYYAPRLNSNFFFYDGLYWLYRDDDVVLKQIGTTGHGNSLAHSTFPCTCCAYRFATTASPRNTSVAGAPMPRHAGGNTGVATGKRNVADGTNGIGAQSRLLRPCPHISVTIGAMTTRVPPNNSIRFAPKITATSHVKA